ncbi:MAG: PEGA domain-containing protein [Deltaproteobacteria bacterium]|nr:PEGA domain-containing protein [Deltaproteobacteria bacterium]
MRRIFSCLVLIAVAAAVLSPSSADAQRQRRRAAAEPAGPTAEDRATAREAYGRGQAHLEAGEFEQSEAAFMEAYGAVPNPVVLIGVAHARERAGNAAGAVESFERYLAERVDAPDRAEVELSITELRARPATLVLTSTPPGAAITIDDVARDEVTPAEVEVPPGEYAVALSLEGHEPVTETVTVTFGERHEIAPALVVLPPVADEFGEEGEGEQYEEPEEEATEEDEGIPTGVWVSSAVAGVGLITGSVLGFLALSEQSSFDDNPTEETADNGETLALFADVAFGVAIAGAITAVVLWLTSGSDDDEDDESAELQITPAVSAHGGGVAAGMSF